MRDCEPRKHGLAEKAMKFYECLGRRFATCSKMARAFNILGAIFIFQPENLIGEIPQKKFFFEPQGTMF
jgi:hypothetical protein